MGIDTSIKYVLIGTTKSYDNYELRKLIDKGTKKSIGLSAKGYVFKVSPKLTLIFSESKSKFTNTDTTLVVTAASGNTYTFNKVYPKAKVKK